MARVSRPAGAPRAVEGRLVVCDHQAPCGGRGGEAHAAHDSAAPGGDRRSECSGGTACVGSKAQPPASVQPQLAYTPRTGGVATEASYVRDRDAGPKDAAAERKIEAAVNDLCLVGKMTEAEAQLKGIYEACGDDCSGRVKAEAWMYVGIMGGSGNGNVTWAREVFRYALRLYPELFLDESLATPDTKQAINEEKAALAPRSAPAPATPAPAAAPASAGAQPGEPGVPVVAPPPPPARPPLKPRPLQ